MKNEHKTSYTKQDHTESLNELGVPFHDQRSNGGRDPDNALFGNWMRAHDRIAFNVSYSEAKREIEHREDATARYLYRVSQNERTI